MKSIVRVLAGILLICGSAQGQTIRIASVGPLSGSQAGVGEMMKWGAQLAVEQWQSSFEEHGLKLEFVAQDDEASPNVGVDVARRLVQDQSLLAVIGHVNSGVAIPASDVYKDANLAMVSPINTATRLTDRGYENVNRICGRDDVQGRVAATFAVEELKAKRIFIIHDKTIYGQGIAEAYRNRAEELGVTNVGFVGTVEKSNFASLILRMKVQNPDLIYFGGEFDQGGLLFKQIRGRGLTATLLGPDSFDTAEFIKFAQNSAKGVYYTTVAGSLKQLPDAKPMAEAFESKFKRAPESSTFYAYDAANIVLAAIRQGYLEQGRVPTREEVCQAIRSLSYKGITGDIAFDEKGDRKQADYFIVHLDEGKYPGTIIKVISAPAP